jgi:hypothetical protein
MIYREVGQMKRGDYMIHVTIILGFISQLIGLY